MVRAVQLTARTAGAIAVILVTGDGSGEVVGALASPARVCGLGVRQFARATLKDAAEGAIDDALVVRTGEDRWELHVHGGVAVVNAVLNRLGELGVQYVPLKDAGALLGADHELQCALVRAQTRTALKLMLAQAQEWGEWTAYWQRRLAAGSPLWPLHAAAQWVLHRSATLRQLLEPARVAIIGPPNAGKSTLANALLGRPMSITSDQAGTTRDWVDAQAIFSAGDVQMAVTLVDTAGVRHTGDALEHASIARTHDQAKQADVIIFLLDATGSPSAEELALLESLLARPLVLACNKRDALTGELPAVFAKRDPVLVSARTHDGLDVLMASVLRRLRVADGAGAPFAFSAARGELLASLSVCDDRAACGRILTQLAEGLSSAIPSPSDLFRGRMPESPQGGRHD